MDWSLRCNAFGVVKVEGGGQPYLLTCPTIGENLAFCFYLLETCDVFYHSEHICYHIQNIDASTIIEGLLIAENPQLSTCAIENICTYLSVNPNTATIYRNAIGCASREEVEAACMPSPQCPECSVTLLTQADVDAYLAAYPNCTEIPGNVKIGNGSGSTDINSLAGLSSVTRIGGFLSVFFNNNLSFLQGLHALTSVGRNLSIFRNNGLTSMTGLDALTTINGNLISVPIPY